MGSAPLGKAEEMAFCSGGKTSSVVRANKRVLVQELSVVEAVEKHRSELGS